MATPDWQRPDPPEPRIGSIVRVVDPHPLQDRRVWPAIVVDCQGMVAAVRVFIVGHGEVPFLVAPYDSAGAPGTWHWEGDAR